MDIIKRMYFTLFACLVFLPAYIYGNTKTNEAVLSTTAGTITGPQVLCVRNGASTGNQYTVTGSSATSGYSWTVPSGATITAGAGSNVITVTFTVVALGQNISVSGNGLSASLTINTYGPLSAAPIITGPSAVCPGQTGVVYSCSTVPGANSYQWFAPTNASIASGNGTQSVTVNFSSSYTGTGSFGVFGTVGGPCDPGPITSMNIPIVAIPAAPGSITGPVSITPGVYGVAYSVPAISGATSYQWNLPANATLASGSGTNSITVNFSTSYTGGSITVKASNGLCFGPNSPVLTVVPAGLPNAAGTISGNMGPCVGTSGTTITYSIPVISNATSYNWVITGGASVVGSATSNSININFPASIPENSVTLSVNGVNPSGSGPSSTATVTLYKGAKIPAAIEGPAAVCQNQTSVVYSVSPITDATSTIWTPPSGATVVSGMGTTTLTLNFSGTFVSGTLGVYGLSGPCGQGPTITIAISTPAIAPLAAGPIMGPTYVCQASSGIAYSVPAIDNAAGYVWTIPSGATIASGQNTNSITVNYSASAASGNITVYGTNCAGNGATSTRAIVAGALPGTPGTILGNASPCLGNGIVIYTIAAISNATSYNWTIPTGATIESGQGTNSITVNYPLSATPGNVTVQGVNCKGSGTTSTLPITYASSVIGNVGVGKIEPFIDIVTGQMSASFPLFSIKDGDIEVPGVLTYTASGVRVTDDDGWVGHNWSLSAQNYQIGRDVRGLPDDYSATSPDNRKGWLNSTVATAVKNLAPAAGDGNPATCSDEYTNYSTLTSFTYDQDTEPDVFFVNAPGLTFQFYFDENKVPRALPYQDVVITPNTVTGAIMSFTVKDAQGILYTFSDIETLTQVLQDVNNFYLVRQNNLYRMSTSYATAWRLTSMTSPVYGTISFTYRSVTLNDPALIPQPFKYDYRYRFNESNLISNTPGTTSNYSQSTIRYQRQSTLKILQKISSPSMEAEFVSTPKLPGAQVERLNAINIYDKRDGVSKLSGTISLIYSVLPENRAFLTTITRSAGCAALSYQMEYNAGSLPTKNSLSGKDDWDFYKTLQYNESVIIGTLKKITYPYKGYDVFFYEPHDYMDGTQTVRDGGIRLKKMISYNGVSTNDNTIKEYEYKKMDGTSSGKIQYKAFHDFNVTRQERRQVSGTWWEAGYRYQYALSLGYATNVVNALFLMHSDVELSHYRPFHGSAVAYERVTEKIKDAGQSIYEFSLPASYGDASANSNEWMASKVAIARPSTGTSTCYDLANVQQGMNQYPFPPDPDYDFAKGLLTKRTDLREDGSTARDVVYTYQRIYGNGSSIRKIYGLALEELPTYYYNGSSYTDYKMFLFSKYEVFTEVKTEVSSEIETVYNSSDLAKKTVTTTNYFFDSPNHRELVRVEKLNSDGSTTRSKLKYVKDYTITTPSGTQSTALMNLVTAHRTAALVETTVSKVVSGMEKFIGANLILFQTISGKVYPDKQYSFQSGDGITTFTPSSISGGTTFQYDQMNHVLDKTYLGYDAYGNSTEVIDRSRRITGAAYGYSGTLPVINVINARIDELKYSDFDTSAPVNFTPSWASPTYGIGRNNSKSLNFPAGSSGVNMLTANLSNNNTKNYILSFWAKTTVATTLSLQVGTSTSTTFTYSLPVSSVYKYYSFKVPVSGVIGTALSFYSNLWSSAAIEIDDLAYFPEQADFTTNMYSIPYGLTVQTDSRGISQYFDYDLWGRLKVQYDRNKYVVKKYDYTVKP